MEQTLLGAAGLLAVGAITPGPNNFVVMREAARGGWRGALAAGTGVVAGSLVLLLFAAFGVGGAVAAEPRLAAALATAGALYLSALGVRMLAARGAADGEAPAADGLPAGVWGLLAFQLVNPKAWILVLTVTASVQSSFGALRGLPALAALFVLVPAACLALWSWAGVALVRSLRRPAVRRWFDRAMGALLVASAVPLVLDAWR